MAMKTAHWLLLGIGAVALFRYLNRRNAGTAGLGQEDLVPKTPPDWYNTGLTPIGYEPTGYHPPDEWKRFAQRRAELRAQGLGQSEWEPFTHYPLSVPIYQTPFVLGEDPFSPFGMPYAPTLSMMYEEAINWKAPHMKPEDISDEGLPF